MIKRGYNNIKIQCRNVEMQKYRKLGDGESLGSSDKWDLKRERGEGLVYTTT